MIICLGSYLVGFNLCDIVVSGLMSRVVGSCPVCFRQGCSILKHRLRHINRKQCETCSTWGAFFLHSRQHLSCASELLRRLTNKQHMKVASNVMHLQNLANSSTNNVRQKRIVNHGHSMLTDSQASGSSTSKLIGDGHPRQATQRSSRVGFNKLQLVASLSERVSEHLILVLQSANDRSRLHL